MALFNHDPQNRSRNQVLYDERVYLSGEEEDFEHGKEKLANELTELGTRIVEFAYADVVVVGNNKPLSDVAEQVKRRWNGYADKLTMTEEQVLRLLSQDTHVRREVAEKGEAENWKKKLRNTTSEKKLTITYDLLLNPVYTPIAHFTDDEDAPTLDGKVVFMLNADDKDDIRTDPIKLFLEQQMGAIVTAAFDPRRMDYCLLRERTINSLKEGKKEDFIDMIEVRYNSSSCYEFRPEFILESEVLALMKRMGQE